MITIDARLVNASGIGTFLKGVLEELKKRKHLKLSLLHWKKDASQIGHYNASRTIVLKSPIYSIQEQLELPLKIPSSSLFFSPHINIPLFPIRAKKRLATIHDLYHLAFAKEKSLFERIHAFLIYNAATLYSDKIATVSRFSYSEIYKRCKIPPKAISIITQGVRAMFVPTPLKRNAAYQLPSSYLLAVGNLKPHKNLKNLVRAIAKLDIKEKLVLVGSKEMRTYDRDLFDEVKKQKMEERVVWLGYVSDEDLPAIYSNATLLIFPSLYEGFGVPPLEAMACGCPVLASDKASIPEVCGDAVQYIEPHLLAENILSLLKDPAKREELKRRGFERAKLFPLQKSASNFVDLMESML